VQREKIFFVSFLEGSHSVTDLFIIIFFLGKGIPYNVRVCFVNIGLGVIISVVTLILSVSTAFSQQESRSPLGIE